MVDGLGYAAHPIMALLFILDCWTQAILVLFLVQKVADEEDIFSTSGAVSRIRMDPNRQNSGTHHNTQDILVCGSGSWPLENTRLSMDAMPEIHKLKSSRQIFEEAVKIQPNL
ncbi:hypothetical protein SASPL_130543 [Salvia splendens]|uniref:Uncharacterized protein n=1 Tax=Salvia splendens TaxID=180675 RepID=A0A8X8X974_SALSN|nr:hypothetical protein SASPL_130543 [Salvia splendens]